MNATDDKTRAFLDVLPTRGGKRVALRWLPATGDFNPQAGFAVLDDDKLQTAYALTEYPCAIGRGFFFSKVGGKDAGTDKTRGGYCVECGTTAAQDRCECRGFQRWGWCRHCDAARTLLINAWL